MLVGDAVQASRLLGFGRAYVLRRHLLPALAPTLGTLLAFTTAQAVLALAALGFVGVGAGPYRRAGPDDHRGHALLRRSPVADCRPHRRAAVAGGRHDAHPT